LTIGEAKQFLYDLVSMYHPKALIVWTKTKGVTPRPPYITLSHSSVDRNKFPIVDDEGEKWYSYSFVLEMNLYTVGKAVEVEGGTVYENTAVEDLEEFIRFVDSDGISDLTQEKNITIMQNAPIRDLSELIGDTKFNYRSMTEFIVTFTDKVSGEYGVQNKTIIPNPSGGGTEEFSQAETYGIEKIVIKEDI
jgi:hypothetical protein